MEEKKDKQTATAAIDLTTASQKAIDGVARAIELHLITKAIHELRKATGIPGERTYRIDSAIGHLEEHIEVLTLKKPKEEKDA